MQTGFKRKLVRFRIHAPPSCLDDPVLTVSRALNKLLLQYDERVGGILVAYRNIRLEEPSAYILGDQPLLHFGVNVELTLFSPKRGMMLRGVVNRLGFDHVAMIVYGAFSASVPASAMRQGVSLEDGEMMFDSQPVQVGTSLTFTVAGIDVAHALMHIDGALVDPRCAVLAVAPPSNVPSEPLLYSPAIAGAEAYRSGANVIRFDEIDGDDASAANASEAATHVRFDDNDDGAVASSGSHIVFDDADVSQAIVGHTSDDDDDDDDSVKSKRKSKRSKSKRRRSKSSADEKHSKKKKKSRRH
jgi:RPA43 OB domain in RNA Pol I